MTKHWWQKTTIYQIYPRSFKDTNNDGIGDLGGIISKLDYIKDLGFETIWISPFFSSPQRDWGYDVADYYSIAPEYGDMSDVYELIKQIHQRKMRVLIDLVMNHTSEQHPWFQESRRDQNNPKRDWYIWRDGRDARPPNNWKSIVGKSGWNYDPGSDQWYYASFLSDQPDLNYRNPEVKEMMFNVARYWLDKGIDGFRLDLFHRIFKDENFRDNPRSFQLIPRDFVAGFFQTWTYNLNQPETIQLAHDLRALVDTYTPERILLGELFGEDDVIKKYLGDDLNGLHLAFLWQLMDLRADSRYLRSVMHHYETQYPEPYTPVYVFGNHDRKRLISRIGNDTRLLPLLALFQYTVRGVPVTYYGEEIGMAEVDITRKSAKDPVGQLYKWIPEFIYSLLDIYANRDGCRSPMQWDESENSGFCNPGVSPWLPIHHNYRQTNVSNQLDYKESLLNIYKKLIELRKNNQAIQEGSLRIIDINTKPGQLLAYTRKLGQEKIVVVINFGKRDHIFKDFIECQKVIFNIGGYDRIDQTQIRIYPLSGFVLSN